MCGFGEKIMEPKDDDKYWRIQFSLHKLISPCVCASDLGEDSLCGWKQREERKERRKRIELSRAERQNSLSRKNREKPSEPPSPCDGFVFRHYEESHRYIEQYRENHSLSRVDSDVELRPVLGVDVPDPYLPKICHTSDLLQRMKLIEAIAELYNDQNTPTRSDVESFSLTGIRAETAELNTRPSLPTRSKTFTYLPTICQKQPTNRNQENHTIAAIVKKHSRTKNRKEEKKQEDLKHRTSVKQSLEKRASEEQTSSVVYKFELPSAERLSRNSVQQTKTLEVKACFGLKDIDNDKNVSNTKNIVNFRTRKKVKSFDHSSGGESTDEMTARQQSEEAGTQGSVYTGSTVKPNTVRVARVSGVSLGKCELSNQNSTLTNSSGQFFSGEAFIGVMGQATGTQSKTKVKLKMKSESDKKPRKKEESTRFSLPYISHVGKRHQFHYVLHAHAYKPNGKLDGTTVTDLYLK